MSLLFSSFRASWTGLKKTAAVLPVTLIALQSMVPLAAQAIDFPDTGDRGAPSTTAGGGTRGGWCEGEMAWSDDALIPMVPKNNVSTFTGEQASLWIAAAPEFSHKNAEIFVRNMQTNETVYVEVANLGDLTEEMVHVELPALNDEGEPLLEADQTYFWEFAVICNQSAREQDYYVRGLMQPVETSAQLAEQLESADTMEEKAALYASEGIWQETLAIGIELNQSEKPEVLAELLTSVGLDTLLSE